MTVVMQAAPTATGSLPGASSQFANVAGGLAAPADGSPFAAVLLSLANAQATDNPATPALTGTPANPPIVVALETPATTPIEPMPAMPETIEVILQDPLDASSDELDPAALSAQAALLANQALSPSLPLETSPLLEAAVSEEVNPISANGVEPTVVVSADALMPALTGIRDEEETLRTNRPSVLAPLSATPATGEPNQAEPELNANLGDVVGQPLTSPTGANDAAGEIGRGMRSAATSTDTPGVVRFDGNASSQNQVAQPAIALPLPPAETDPTARVSILSTFASSQAAATSPVAAQAVANAAGIAPEFDPSKSNSSEDESPSTDAVSSAMRTSESPALDAIAGPAIGEAMAAPGAQSAVTREPADDMNPAGPSEVRPPSATPSNPAAPSAVAAPIAPGAPARIDSAPGASAPAAPAPTSEPAIAPPAVAQVARTVLEAIESGGGEARLHLKPRELGDVVIHVRTVGDRVEVMVQAERSEAVNVIRENANGLTGLLGESGLNLTNLNVSFGMQQQGRGWGGEPATLPNNRPGDDNEFATVLGTDPAVASTNHKRLRATYNPDGAHLYRV